MGTAGGFDRRRSDRLSAGIPVRDVCRMNEAGSRLRLDSQHRMPIRRSFTGASGLEPATSGVTGHFDHRKVDDVRCGIALSMWSRRRSGGCLRTPERRRFQAFAARLLPDVIL